MKYKKKFKSKMRPKKQVGWKKMVGIAKKGIDMATNIPGPIGLVARSVKGITNLINVEQKYSDTTISSSVSNAGYVLNLTKLAQGNGDTQRNGNSVLSKSLDLKTFLYLNELSTLKSTAMRVAIVIDKQNAKGTAPTINEIYQSSDYYLSFLNKDTSDRFVVLHDERFTLNLNGETSYTHNHHINLTDLHIKYDGTDATQASCAENHIYLVCSSSVSTNAPAIVGYCRYNYVDN